MYSFQSFSVKISLFLEILIVKIIIFSSLRLIEMKSKQKFVHKLSLHLSKLWN